MVDRHFAAEHQLSPRNLELETIQKAIKKALAAFLELNLTLLDYTEFDGEYFKTITDNRCKVLSANTAKLLETEYGYLWQKVFILTSHFPELEGFKTDPQYNKPGARWKFHTYCILESTSGHWYAFSPGNITLPKVMPTILSGDSLENLQYQIRNQDGGDWLPAEKIRTAYEEYQKLGPNLAIPSLHDYVCEVTQKFTGKPTADAFILGLWRRQTTHPHLMAKLIQVFQPQTENELERIS